MRERGKEREKKYGREGEVREKRVRERERGSDKKNERRKV